MKKKKGFFFFFFFFFWGGGELFVLKLDLCTQLMKSVMMCEFSRSRFFFFLIQFYVPFKIISAHMRRANQWVGRKRENPEKNHLTHPQAELGLSHMWPERGSNPHQSQR